MFLGWVGLDECDKLYRKNFKEIWNNCTCVFQSLADRFARLMERSGDENQDKEDAPFWLKYGARIVGTVGGVCKWFLKLFEF